MFLKTKCTHGDWNRRINATTNSAKKEVRILLDMLDWKKECCWYTEMEGGEEDQGENGWMRYMK